MNRVLGLISALLLALTLSACDGLTAPDPVSPTAVEATADLDTNRPVSPFTLALGKTTRLRGEDRFTFNEVVSDSRCPSDVNCPWAGQAETRFTLVRASGETYSITLTLPGGTPGGLPLADAPWATVGGYVVHLLRLQPYPGYAPDAGLPVTATLVAAPCSDRCYGVYPPSGDQDR